MPEIIPLEKIRLDGGTQLRVTGIVRNTVAKYVELLQSELVLPPIDVFWDSQNYWLADGFHRVEAFKELSWTEITCTVHNGSRRDALLFSICSNNHGLPRTRADLRNAVLTLLQDEEWAQWSDREIARAVGCSPTTVGNVRRYMLSKMDNNNLNTTDNTPETRKVRRNDGVEYVRRMNKKKSTPPNQPNDSMRQIVVGDFVLFIKDEGGWLKDDKSEVIDIDMENRQVRLQTGITPDKLSWVNMNAIEKYSPVQEMKKELQELGTIPRQEFVMLTQLKSQVEEMCDSELDELIQLAEKLQTAAKHEKEKRRFIFLRQKTPDSSGDECRAML